MNNSDESASPALRVRAASGADGKVLQRRRCAFIAVANVGQVHLLGAATEDGLFFRCHHAVTNQLLEQRQHKLRLLTIGVALIAVGAIHVQRVDVGIGRSRNADHLAAKGFGQIAELRLRVRMRMSSSVESAICTISSLALMLLPEPDTPKRKLLPLSSRRRSATIMFLLTAFCP